MAARMDGYAARDPNQRLRAEWLSLATYWRGLAHQADRQDSYTTRAS
ncbi:hypothetical protein [Brevundimonas sp.]|nr:hypothetical protein [Brevundimonas sp.]HYC68618.1 hypothetical protein [Brevundimonas sp.]